MIQRKQSVYLLLVAVIMSWLLIRPYAEIVLKDNHVLEFYSHTIKSYSSDQDYVNIKYTIPLVLLVLLTGSLNFVNIFLYTRRVIQIRLCMVSAALLAIILLTMLYYYIMINHSYAHWRQSFRLASIFPVVGIILNFMAYRGIHQDEMLVKSYDRIR
jgi:hypothetical protein